MINIIKIAAERSKRCKTEYDDPQQLFSHSNNSSTSCSESLQSNLKFGDGHLHSLIELDVKPVPVLPRVEPDIVHLVSEYLESSISSRPDCALHCLSAGTGTGLLGLNIHLVVDDVVQHHVHLISHFLRKHQLLPTPIVFRLRHPWWRTVQIDFGAINIILLKAGVIISIAGIFLTIKQRIIFQIVLFS